MIIPIVFATNESYVIPLATAIVSLFQNARESTQYNVYVLCDGQLPGTLTEKVISITGDYARHTINVVPVNDKVFDGIELEIAHITKETYFRLFLADVLPDLNRCIYLDCDTVVMQDLSELFSTELADNLIAGVKAATFFFPPDGVAERIKNLNIPSIEQYVNAGVLLMDVGKIRAEGLTEKFIEASKKNMDTQDQGVINSVCYGRIMHVPLKYNAMTKYVDPDSYVRWRGERVYLPEELKEAESNPVIIHYADSIKPWHNLNAVWSDVWYHYKGMTAFADVEYKPQLVQGPKHFSHHDAVDKIGGFHELSGKRVVLWGGGRLGTFYAECLQKLGIPFTVTDKNAKKFGAEVIPGIAVKSWDELKDGADIILVSALNITDKVRKNPDITIPVYDLPESIKAGKLV